MSLVVLVLFGIVLFEYGYVDTKEVFLWCFIPLQHGLSF